MGGPSFEMTAKVWRHDGASAWHFVTLPDDVAGEIRDWAAGQHRPFGSLRVRARLGETTWATSLFADTRRGSYLLPIRAEVRKREGVDDGDVAAVTITLDG